MSQTYSPNLDTLTLIKTYTHSNDIMLLKILSEPMEPKRKSIKIFEEEVHSFLKDSDEKELLEEELKRKPNRNRNSNKKRLNTKTEGISKKITKEKPQVKDPFECIPSSNQLRTMVVPSINVIKLPSCLIDFETGIEVIKETTLETVLNSEENIEYVSSEEKIVFDNLFHYMDVTQSFMLSNTLQTIQMLLENNIKTGASQIKKSHFEIGI